MYIDEQIENGKKNNNKTAAATAETKSTICNTFNHDDYDSKNKSSN